MIVPSKLSTVGLVRAHPRVSQASAKTADVLVPSAKHQHVQVAIATATVQSAVLVTH